MTTPERVRRERQIALVQQEISLAVLDAQAYVRQPWWGHVVWHGCEQFLRGRDPLVWADEIEIILLPRMLASADPDWAALATFLPELIASLRRLDPGPWYGCGRCTV